MDTEPAIARSESINAREALAIIDLRAARAQKAGDYGLHADLTALAELIERLDAQNDELLGLSRSLSKLSQTLAAGVESLSRVPA